jgi:hypothetical protein
VVPALWGRLSDDQWEHHEPYNPPHDKGNRSSISAIDHLHRFAFKGDYHKEDVHPPEDCSRHPDQTVEVPHEEQKKKWWDLEGDRKKQLEVQTSLILTYYQATHDGLGWRWAFGRCGPYRRWLRCLAET